MDQNTDIIFGTDTVTIDAPFLELKGDNNSKGSDFRIYNAARISNKSKSKLRRAMVHDQGDKLTLNYENDYPGGVNIVGEVNLKKVTTDNLFLDGDKWISVNSTNLNLKGKDRIRINTPKLIILNDPKTDIHDINLTVLENDTIPDNNDSKNTYIEVNGSVDINGNASVKILDCDNIKLSSGSNQIKPQFLKGILSGLGEKIQSLENRIKVLENK